MDFDKIKLTASQMDLLVELEQNGCIKYGSLEEKASVRELMILVSCGLVSSASSSLAASITDHGRLYLAWCRGAEEQKRKESRRYHLSLGIAIFAAIVSAASLIMDIFGVHVYVDSVVHVQPTYKYDNPEHCYNAEYCDEDLFSAIPDIPPVSHDPNPPVSQPLP